MHCCVCECSCVCIKLYCCYIILFTYTHVELPKIIVFCTSARVYSSVSLFARVYLCTSDDCLSVWMHCSSCCSIPSHAHGLSACSTAPTSIYGNVQQPTYDTIPSLFVIIHVLYAEYMYTNCTYMYKMFI